MPDLPYGEFPAHNARMDDIALSPAILVVRNPTGDHDEAFLVGDVPPGNYQDEPHDCVAEASGYRWTFQGRAVLTEPVADKLRVWVGSSGGDVSAEPLP